MHPMTRLLPFAALLAAGCLAPGAAVAPSPADFAFLEIHLQG